MRLFLITSHANRWLSIAVISVLAVIESAAPAETPQPAATGPATQSMNRLPAGLDNSDPASAVGLNARLEYAATLVGTTDGPLPCLRRLEEAQSRLDEVQAQPSIDVLPSGRARVADLEYRVHAARAAEACGGDPSKRTGELHEALTAAQSAVNLYRDAWDYRSMVIMQFDVAVTQKMLSDDAQAVAALQATIAMDRDLGFREDAAENYNLLAKWQGQHNPAEWTAQSMADFPTRSTTLSFGWSDREADIAINLEHVSVSNAHVAHYRGSRTFKRTIRKDDSYWSVTDEAGNVSFDIDAWPSKPKEIDYLVVSLERDLLAVPDIDVAAEGDFVHSRSLPALEHRLSVSTQTVLRTKVNAGDAATSVPTLKEDVLNRAFTLPGLNSKARADYDLETAIWIGATLEQGEWYSMTAPLPLPGAPSITLPHDVEFAYTRAVPCTTAATDRECVEIIVRASPQPDALDSLTKEASHGRIVDYWGATYVRLVTNPHRLMPTVRDVQRYWHLATGDTKPADVENRSARLIMTSTYL
jgi:hypothetical protein